MALLNKTATGDWINHEGFIGAIMLVWQAPDHKDGRRHYRFIATPFDQHPHDIVHNGEDDAVLISKDMLGALIARGVARRMTDEEAAIANANARNEDIMDVHAENMTSKLMVDAENAKEKEKKVTAADASKPAPPVILPIPPVQENVEGEKSQEPAARAPAGKVGKEGK